MKAIAALLLMMALLLLPACKGEISTRVSSLPEDAEVVKLYGNGWIEFRLNGRLYLYHKGYDVYQGYECITQIIEE